MQNNLQLYHKMLRQFRQWTPDERITRLRNLALLVIGLYLGGSVHLAHIVRTWPVEARIASLTHRLRRFLRNHRLDVWRVYEPLVAQLKAFAGQSLTLILDVTQVGRNHRALVVALAYRRRSLPLVWQIYEGYSGGTDVMAHIALLDRIYRLVPSNCQVVVLGDTEFRSVDLLRWLTKHDWHYVIRQRHDTNVRQEGISWQPIEAFPLQPGETLVVGWVWLAKTNPFYPTWLLLHWAEGEDQPWYLVSDRPGVRLVLRAYRRRMWIEEMFGDMKRHGFDLEATHLRHPQRIHRLLLGVSITYVWLVSLGSWVVKNSYRSLVDRKHRRDKSYFRLGWDWIQHCIRLGKPIRVQFSPYP